ncbi:MAG: hypothetical protein KKG78_13970 [Alphaproteobacteria bacterium]|nr:hypothetical protein [Alphaproteobacteria bacterium]
MLSSLGQVSQARKVARWCLAKGIPAPTDDSAAKAAIALLDDAEAAVDLALLNDLHKNQGFGHTMFRIVLNAPFVRTDEMEPAIHRFYQASIDAHEIRAAPIGAIRYSYANYLVSIGQFLSALKQFNQARRDEPDYWNRPYFLREIGGLLFRSRRYRASARAYRCAVDVEPTEQTWFCLGDAELYVGNFPAAMEAFDYATASIEALGAEARLKYHLASWALESGAHDIGNWNVIHSIRENAFANGERKAWFWAHLALTFYFEDDVACWADSIFLALMQNNAQLLEDVLVLSVQRTRLESYTRFKDDRSDFLALDPLVAEELDRRAVAYNQQALN